MNEQEALDHHAHGHSLQIEGRHGKRWRVSKKAAEYFATVDLPQTPDLAKVFTDWYESLLALCRYDEAEQNARSAEEILEPIRDLLDPPSQRDAHATGACRLGEDFARSGPLRGN